MPKIFEKKEKKPIIGLNTFFHYLEPMLKLLNLWLSSNFKGLRINVEHCCHSLLHTPLVFSTLVDNDTITMVMVAWRNFYYC